MQVRCASQTSDDKKDEKKTKDDKKGNNDKDEDEDESAGSLYDVLELPRGASPEEVKAAYRRLAKEYHPDLHPGNEAALAKFRAVNHAHQTLLHVGLRRMYDLHLRHQEAREKASKIEDTERKSGITGVLLMRRGRLEGAFVAAFWATSFMASSYLFWVWLTYTPGVFWSIFRAIPESVPGKWGLAEFYLSSAAAQRRHPFEDKSDVPPKGQ